MARAQRRGRGFGVRKIPNYEWVTLNSLVPIGVPAASKVIIGSFLLQEPNDIVVQRTRGMLQVQTDVFSAAVEEQFGAFGMIIVSEDAFAVGASALPGPVTDGFQDWFLWMPICQTSNVASAIGYETNVGTRDVIDSKAQRVWTVGNRVAIIAENAHATHAFEVSIAMRLLIKLRA